MKRIPILFVILILLALACETATLEDNSQPTRQPIETQAATNTESQNLVETPQQSENSSNEELVTTPTSDSTTSLPIPSGDVATVTHIVDGDTIDVSLNGQTYRVRYIGMDTPERGDVYFGEATEANRSLVEGKTVILVKDVSETDRYGRLLRYIYLEDGTFVNAELVKQGYALIASYPPDVRHQELFLELQQEARNANRGLWGLSATPQLTNTPQSQPLPSATQVPQTTQQAGTSGNVQIVYIFYDGQKPQTEGDEYVEIQNVGETAVNLSGWRLNADDQGQDFWFPSFDLQPGQSCRIYTNENHPEYCGFNFGRGRAIWANTGECGHLFDVNGLEVSTYCY